MNEHQRRILWFELSDLFLDTETRPDLPGCAARCLDTGVSVACMKRVFYEELTPHLISNIFSPCGVWQSFDEDFLFEAMHRPVQVSALMRCQMKPLWRALEGMILFLRASSQRHQARNELEVLARIFFDFEADVKLFFPCATRDRERLGRRYKQDFKRLFDPILNCSEQHKGELRIQSFLKRSRHSTQPSGTTPKR